MPIEPFNGIKFFGLTPWRFAMALSNQKSVTEGKVDKPQPMTPTEILAMRERSPEYALAGMNAELLKKYELIREWDQDESRRSIMSRYQLGKVVEEVKDDEEVGGYHYGARSMKKLTTALGWDDSLLYATWTL